MLVYLLITVLGALVGGAAFFLLPIVINTTKMGHKYVWLSMFAVKRGAFVLQDDGELNFKKFKYDSIGSEKLTLGGDTITLSDPARALQTLKGKTFALADETHGVVFRVTDSLGGSRKQTLNTKGEMVSQATKKERSDHGVSAWIRKYIRIPEYTSTDLRDVRALATGSEKGSDPALVREWFKFSRIRENSGTSILKLLLPVGAFLATLIIFWQASTRGGGSSGGTAGNTTNTTISALWIASVGLSNRFKAIGGVVLVVVGLVLCYLTFGLAIVGYPIALLLGLAFGFVGTMALVLFLSLIGGGAWMATFFLDMGLQTFDNPTFIETSDGFELRDVEVGGVSHKLGKHRLTFVADGSAIRDRRGFVGTKNHILKGENNGPRKVPSEGGEQFGHFIHRFSGGYDEHYLTSFGVVSSLRSGFVGKDTNERHKEAKEEFGDGIRDVGTKFILGATFAGILLACAVGWFLL